MHVRANDAAIHIAQEMIAAGKVNSSDPWTFTSDEAAEILGDPPDWDRYGAGFVGLRTGVSRKTKKAYAYPFGKGGEVYRSALLAARSMAAQAGDHAAFDAAGELLASIDGDEDHARARIADNMALIGDRPAVAFSLEAIPMDDLPTSVIQLLPFTGDDTVRALDGRELRISDYSLDEVQRNHAGRVNSLLVDYEHDTYNPFISQSSLAAGWIRELFIAGPGAELEDKELMKTVAEYGPGIYARVDWTKAAAEKIKAREYRYVSPVVRTNDEDTVVEAVGAAITNDPALDGMMPLAAKKKAEKKKTDNKATGAAGAAPDDPGRHREEPMEHMDFQTLSALLGRPVTTAADAQAAIEELRSDGVKSATQEDELETLRAEKLTRDAEVAVDAAIKDGQLDAKQRAKGITTYTDERAAWDSFISLTPKGTFKNDPKPEPPQDRLTPDPEEEGSAPKIGQGFALIPGITAFGKKVSVNKDEIEVLRNATVIADERFKGDLARGIRAARR
jgi:phage I-like protein